MSAAAHKQYLQPVPVMRNPDEITRHWPRELSAPFRCDGCGRLLLEGTKVTQFILTPVDTIACSVGCEAGSIALAKNHAKKARSSVFNKPRIIPLKIQRAE
jgi:hypothetical protein